MSRRSQKGKARINKLKKVKQNIKPVVVKKVKPKPEPESYQEYLAKFKQRQRYVHNRGAEMLEDRPLEERTWNYWKKADGGYSNKEIIDQQTYTRTRKQALNIQKALERAGIRKTISEIMYGQGEEYLNIINETYQDLINQGMDSYEAQQTIAFEFFGSPK